MPKVDYRNIVMRWDDEWEDLLITIKNHKNYIDNMDVTITSENICPAFDKSKMVTKSKTTSSIQMLTTNKKTRITRRIIIIQKHQKMEIKMMMSPV